MLAKSVLLIVLLGVVQFSTSAPLKADENGEETINIVHTDLEQDQNTDISSESLTTAVPPKQDDKNDLNKEVTNYQTIEVDGNSKVEEEAEEAPAKVEEEQSGLTDEEAEALLMELSNPAEIAQFIVASDDAAGFINALRLLTDQEYISLKVAYYLRDRVMDELRRMLMLQEMALSRTLLNNYEPTDFTQDQLPQNEPLAPYYDFNPFLQEEVADYPQTAPYDVYEDSIRQENTRAIAEIAEAVAQQISTGEMTPENGAKIMNTVASLFPDSYWEDALDVLSEDNTYPLNYDDLGSDYSIDSIGSDVIEVPVNEDEDSEEMSENSSELENELKNKHLRLENALEKQLVEKAHIKEKQSMGPQDAEKMIEEDASKEHELIEEDYEAFFDWLDKEMGRVPQPDEVEAILGGDDVRDDEGGERTGENDS